MREWKTEREGPALSALKGLRNLTEQGLQDMLEGALRSSRALRRVELDLAFGVQTLHDLHVVPIPKWDSAFGVGRLFPQDARPVVVVRVRSEGNLTAFVRSCSVAVGLPDKEGTVLEIRAQPHGVVGSYLARNPHEEPVEVSAYREMNWVAPLEVVRRLSQEIEHSVLADRLYIWGKASLTSGETVESTQTDISKAFPR
jgi:hypothetical protein